MYLHYKVKCNIYCELITYFYPSRLRLSSLIERRRRLYKYQLGHNLMVSRVLGAPINDFFDLAKITLLLEHSCNTFKIFIF